MASTNEFASTLHTLKDSFIAGHTRSVEWRLNQIKKVTCMLHDYENDFCDAMWKDLGKGALPTKIVEITSVEMEAMHFSNNLREWLLPIKVPSPLVIAPASSYYTFEPLGVALIIGPFNYPILSTIMPLIGAIAAGNCAVIKPSELTPHVSNLFAELIPKYLDTQCFKVICGGIEVNKKLLELPWNKIFFTGSPRVGKIVATAAAQHLTPVTLELGGKSPTIVDEDCGNIDVTARRIIWGKMGNAGQTCIAPDYVLCHSKHYDQLLKKMLKYVEKFYGADPRASQDFGRIVTESHVDRLQGLIDECGGKILIGGQVDRKNRYVGPTIITDLKLDSKLMKEEIFGPVLPVIKIDSLQEAVNFIRNREDAPLTTTIFTENRKHIDMVKKNVQCGMLLVNDVLIQSINSNLPFGGVGNSGFGVYRGKFSLETFSQRRACLEREISPLFDIPFRYPPYSAGNMRVIGFVSKLPDFPPLPTIRSITSYFVAACVGGFIALLFKSLRK